MTMINQISVLILTYNEEPNIGRTLEALARFEEVVVLDSGSSDGTANVVSQYPNARLVTRPFDNHATQWSYGLDNMGIARRWILALDADYVLSPALVDEIEKLHPLDDQGGYRVAFRYCIHGRRLSASLYPAHVVLYRRDRARYTQEGHTQRVIVDGKIDELVAQIDHDDRKSLTRWLSSQLRYARLEADHLLGVPQARLRLVDKIRLTGTFGPFLVFFYTLLVKRCILDGWPGWLYVLQRTTAEIMIALYILDHNLSINKS